MSEEKSSGGIDKIESGKAGDGGSQEDESDIGKGGGKKKKKSSDCELLPEGCGCGVCNLYPIYAEDEEN